MEDIAPGVTAAPGSATSSAVLPTGPAPGPAAPAAPVPTTTVAIPTGQVTLPTLPATTVAPATSPHVTSDPVHPEIPEDGLDRTEWADSLVKTHAYLSKKKWGDPWATLLSSLVAFEWSFYHQEEFSKLPKGKCRPEEFAQWMKEHRPVMDYPLEADFRDRMLDWWKELGPKKRWDNVGKGEGQLKEPPQDTKGTWCGDWARLRSAGRNGPVLLVLGMAWWGQVIWNAGATDGLGGGDTALAAAADWAFMVNDVEWVLRAVLTQGRAAMDAHERGEENVEGEGEEEMSAEKKMEKPHGKTGAKKMGPAAKAAVGKKRKRVAAGEPQEDSPPTKTRKQTTEDVQQEQPRRPVRNRGRTGTAATRASTRGAGLVATSVVGGEENTQTQAQARETPATSQKDSPVQDITNPHSGTSTDVNAVSLSTALVPTSETVSGATASPSAEPGIVTSESARVRMEVDEEGAPSAEILLLRTKLAEGRKASALDLDPFAEQEGLTAEELAEMNADPEADEDDDA
ncbi:hypothetical protein DFH07DRAFT_972051 [Mycena maculata]|uniref:Uncharacterized protein n=1 Tax=Mycena maculata TaxID=230809 RepID=A0AAD7HKN4_9AGAR|nr:hypothetical protein DFH07DRAFT_972051 [Mycena maculata]